MARPVRIYYPEATYHVMNRGRGKRAVFHGKRWYQAFIDCLDQAHTRFGAEIHGYCLMTNHYHLLVKTPEANLDRIMRHINGVYTQRHNALAKTDGPLFRGRYKALLVEQSAYWLRISRYVHRNPIDTTVPLVKHLEDYPWSSYRCYLGIEHPPAWLYMQETCELSGFHSTAEYQAYVERDNDTELLELLKKCQQQIPILASDQFKQNMLNNGPEFGENTARWERRAQRPSIEFILGHVSNFYGVPSRSLLIADRRLIHTSLPRLMAMHICQVHGGHPLRLIGKKFGYRTYGGVSNALFRFRQLLEGDASIRHQYAELQNRVLMNKTT